MGVKGATLKQGVLAVVGGLLFVLVASIIQQVIERSFPPEVTEAEAVDRYAEKWEECWDNPEIKVDVLEKEFVFTCK